MKVLAIDTNHPFLNEGLRKLGCTVEEDYTSDYDSILKKISEYEGVVIRSRIPVDEKFIKAATKLKFIARVGAGMENIDSDAADKQKIKLFNAPEGNRDAVAEHVLGSLLALTKRIIISSEEVKNGIWLRAENRGDELMGKTIGLIGYGVMGNAVAKRFSGFGVKVLCYDILPDKGNEYAQQVSQEEIFEQTDILSLHIPYTEQTDNLVNKKYLNKFKKNIYVVNTARGKCLSIHDLIDAIEQGKVKGACLDVLEYEKASFEKMDSQNNTDLHYLLQSNKVIVTPHIGGWSVQSNEKMANIIVEKVKKEFFD